MARHHLERRIRDLNDRLLRARDDLAVVDEQLCAVADVTEDVRIRALVSETPLAARELGESQRHLDVLRRARETLASTVADLEHRRDELISSVEVGTR